MADTGYIEAIVPYKLGWNPVYRVPEGMELSVGDRIKVRMNARITNAVVSRTDVVPDIEPSRILPVESICEGLGKITEEEIRLWKFIADYYLCTCGEVFKCAYPSGKVKSEETASKQKERTEATRQKLLALNLARIDAAMQKEKELIARKEEFHNAQVSVHEEFEAVISGLSVPLDKAKAEEKRLARVESLKRRAEAKLARLKLQQEACEHQIEKIRETISLMRARVCELQKKADAKAAATIISPASSDDSRLAALEKAASGRKPVLMRLPPQERAEAFRMLIHKTLDQGKTVLLLVPEIALTVEYENGMEQAFGESLLVFHSKETTVQRRKIADALRREGPHLVIGTRSAIFLPFRELATIIVDEEQDRSYKQDSPAPRYNTRDCAVVMGEIHGATVYLASSAPSLETLHNCATGRYVEAAFSDSPKQAGAVDLRIIDTSAERRKNGMKGQFSRKLMAMMEDAMAQNSHILLLLGWGDLQATKEETVALFPDKIVVCDDGGTTFPEEGEIAISTTSRARNIHFPQGTLVVILQADPMLGARDFRADERAMQVLERFRQQCAGGIFVIQTSRSAHPIFESMTQGLLPYDDMMEERRVFGYPPFSRIIDVVMTDANFNRLRTMSEMLFSALNFALKPSFAPGGSLQISGPLPYSEQIVKIRIIVPKDRMAAGRKRKLKEIVDNFAKDRNYAPFIHLDVDPE